MDQTVKVVGRDVNKALTIIFDIMFDHWPGMILQERKAYILMRFGCWQFLRDPAFGHGAQAINMLLKRITVIGRYQHWRDYGIGRRNVARRAQHCAITKPIRIAAVEHFHHHGMDARRIIMRP